MKKEQVKKFDLEAAFKALDEIEIPVAEKGIKANRVNFKEALNQRPAHETLIEDYYDINDGEALEEAQEDREGEVAQAKLERIEKIVDLDAETADELLPSYVGKYIIQCPQCMTLFYKNEEDIEKSEENPDIVNINEICQHCGNSSGYTLIGKVDAVSPNEADNYTGETEENELNLDFDEVPEEENNEEELDLDLDLANEGGEEELNLEELPEAEEEANESLNLSKAAPSDFESENKSEKLTLNEETETESLNKSEEAPSEHETENGSEETTLNEEVDKDLDKKLKAHNDYIAFIQAQIKETEEALKGAENDEIKDALQRRLDSLNVDLESALPDAVKDEPVIAQEESALVNEAPIEEPVIEEPSEEVETAEDLPEEPVEEALTEETEEAQAEEDNSKEIDYVEYKHSYCHVLEPLLKKINYLCNVLSDEDADLQKCINTIIGYLKKAPELKYTKHEKEFFDNVKAVESKRDLYNYIKNAINKAHSIRVKVDENGELTEGLNEGFEPVDMEESLNKSEEAPSEFEAENKSENLTLNESLNEDADDSIIDSIIASWGNEVSEDLKEEASDAFLDSPEFKEPVSDAEIDAIKDELDQAAEEANESLEECNKQQLTEDPDADAIEAIMDSWNDDDDDKKPAENAPEEPKVADDQVDAAMRSWEEGYTGNPAERTTHLEYTDDDPTDGKAVLPDNIEKQLTESEECKDSECEKPLEECDKKPLKEEDETPAEEEAPVEEPAEGEEAAEEEPKEELPNVDFNTEEVKDLVQDVAEKAAEKAVEIQAEEELDGETKDRVADLADEKVVDAVEEKVEAEEEAPIDEPDISEEPANDLEFDEESIDDLDECSLNKHIDEYLQEVYSNVKCFEATGCEFKDKKLIVEGKISFNSGKEKLTMFEFLPAYCEGKLFFEGYNKDLTEEKAFTLNCSINESKTLITESFGYKYKINENLVEGLK
ncbi:MAG: hypothetical protein J6Z11_05550 [Candidatus Riflebacteria bacterium]|nr:hypothetical protein [Candidatus Riflebacteria bacterium]